MSKWAGIYSVVEELEWERASAALGCSHAQARG